MSESLFDITEAHLNTGLRGFPVGTVRMDEWDLVDMSGLL